MTESVGESEAFHDTRQAPEPTLEMSLEDELQALLGETPAAPAADAVGDIADASLDDWNPRADDEWAGDVESDPTQAQAPVAAPVSTQSGYADADQADADAADDLEAAIAAFADDDGWVEPEPRAATASDSEMSAPGEMDFGDLEADAAAELASGMEAWEPDFSDATEIHSDYNAFASADDAEVEVEADAASAAHDAAGEARMADEPYVEPEAVIDMDPFAALAALAAAPPVLKAFSRTNPVALQPSWDRPAARGDATPTAPAARIPESAPAYTPPAAPSAAPAAYAQPAYVAPVAPAAPSAWTQSAAAAPADVAEMDDAVDIDDFSELMEAGDHFAPEIDTVDVPDGSVALTDELDIPDLAHDDPVPMAAEFDNLESEFASAFSQLSSDEPAAEWQPPQSDPQGDLVDHAFQDALERIEVASAGIAAGHAEPHQARGVDPRYHAAASANRHDMHLAGDGALDANDPFMVDNRYDDSALDEAVRPARNRGLMIAAIVAAVAVAGGIGAFALSFGGSDNGGAPVLVRADPSPVKVKPETPGGVVVPNQDGKVYEQVAGQPAATPTQQKLVTAAEEPIVPAVAGAAAPSEPLPGVAVPQVKAEDRVMQEDVASAA
ncbi:MAG: hypothetical protein Q8Q62_12340, partial [Mesorhizobium sp.]|nr:hypothetical protein [Mesorhizobium sp.]